MPTPHENHKYFVKKGGLDKLKDDLDEIKLKDVRRFTEADGVRKYHFNRHMTSKQRRIYVDGKS